MKRPLFWIGLTFLSITAVVCLFSDLLAVFLAFSTTSALLFLSQFKGKRQVFVILTAAALGAAFSLMLVYFESTKFAPFLTAKEPIYFEMELESVESDGIYNRLRGSGSISCGSDKISTLLTVIVYGEIRLTAGSTAFGTAHGAKLYNGAVYLTANGAISERENTSPSVSMWFWCWQQAISRRVKSLCRNESAAAILSAVLCGDRSDIPDEISGAFRQSGISHLLVVSGMHLVMVSSAFGWLTGFIRSKRLRALLIILFCWSFALLSGFGASVIRAAIMLSLMKAGELFGRRSDTITSLTASAIVMTLCEPRIISSASFLLSFSAVLGIATLQKPFTNAFLALLKPNGKLLSALISAFSCALSAQLATLPVLAFLFGFFPLWGAFANIFTVFLLSPMMLVGFFALLLSLVLPSAATALMGIASLLALIMLRIAKVFADLPFAQLSLTAFWQMVLIISLLFLLSYAVTNGVRGKAAALFTASAASVTVTLALLSVILGFNSVSVVLFSGGENAIIAKGGHAAILGVPQDEQEHRLLKETLCRLGVMKVDFLFVKEKELTANAADILKSYPDCRLVCNGNRASYVFAHSLGKNIYITPSDGVLLGERFESGNGTISISFSHASLLKSTQSCDIIGRYRPMLFLDSSLAGYIV